MPVVQCLTAFRPLTCWQGTRVASAPAARCPVQGKSRVQRGACPAAAFCPWVRGLVRGVPARLCRSGDTESRVCWPVGEVGSVPPGCVTAGGHRPCAAAGSWARGTLAGRCPPAQQRMGGAAGGRGLVPAARGLLLSWASLLEGGGGCRWVARAATEECRVPAGGVRWLQPRRLWGEREIGR